MITIRIQSLHKKLLGDEGMVKKIDRSGLEFLVDHNLMGIINDVRLRRGGESLLSYALYELKFDGDRVRKLIGSIDRELDADEEESMGFVRGYLDEGVNRIRRIIFLGEGMVSGEYAGGIGAGIVPFCVGTGRFLVGMRSGSCYDSYTWGGFGGTIDVGDDLTIKGAAIRELGEETGYTGDIDLVSGYIFRDGGIDFTYYNFIGIVDDEFKRP